MSVPAHIFLIAFGWVGVLLACLFVPERAFSEPAAKVGDAGQSAGRILHVGPSRKLKRPSDAAAIVRRGDTVRIDAGTYADCAIWRTPDITLSGDAQGETRIRDVS